MRSRKKVCQHVKYQECTINLFTGGRYLSTNSHRRALPVNKSIDSNHSDTSWHMD